MNNTNNTNNTFLPSDYTIPPSSRYTKFKNGTTKIRILSNCITGWEYFNIDNKAVRSKEKFKSVTDMQEDWKIKHFWAFIVYNYETKQIEITQINQVNIRAYIHNLCLDPDYWDPKGYDIKITRSWDGMDTKYSVVPWPVTPLWKEIASLYEADDINLNALYEWKDPFNSVNIKSWEL